MDNIQRALQHLADLEGFAEWMEEPARYALETILGNIQGRAPVGIVERPYGRTASDRLGHRPITGSDSWEADVEKGDGSVRLSIKNFSEHIAWVVGGTAPHRIPLSGDALKLLTFQWGGYSQRPGWGPKGDSCVKTPGIVRKFKWVDHPGIAEPYNFVKIGLATARPEAREEIKEGVTKYIRQLMVSSGLREV